MMLLALLAVTSIDLDAQFELTCASAAQYLSLADPTHKDTYERVRAFYEGRLSVHRPGADLGGAEGGEMVLNGRTPHDWQTALSSCVDRYIALETPVRSK